MNTLSFWPVLVASVVAFGLSSLWYSPILFGREWLALLKLSDKDLSSMNESGVWKSYTIQFILTLITFIVLAFGIVAVGERSTLGGASIGFLAWLGFIIPISASTILWKKESFKLVLIDTISILINLVVGGAIIGAWK